MRIHRRILVIDKKERFTIENCRGIFHSSGFKIGHADYVQLPKRIRNAVILVVKLQDLGGIAQCGRAERLLVRRSADANLRVIGRALNTLKITHCHRHQVGRHLGRRGKFDGVFSIAGTGRIGSYAPVRNCGIAFVRNQRDVECRLVSRFVKRRKSAARVCRFKLRGGIVPCFSARQIKSAQLVIQFAGELQVDTGRSRLQRVRHCQRYLFFVRGKAPLRHLRFLVLDDRRFLELRQTFSIRPFFPQHTQLRFTGLPFIAKASCTGAA